MERGSNAIHTAQVSSVDEFRDRTKRAEPEYKPPVHKSAREVVPGAPEPRTMSDAFRKD
jgi:hypothetical protein